MRLLVLGLLCLSAIAWGQRPEELLPEAARPAEVVLNNVAVAPVAGAPAGTTEVRFGTSDWPNILFRAEGAGWDWSDQAVLAVTVFNPEESPVEVALRVDNAGADGLDHCNTVRGMAPAGKEYTLRCRLQRGAGERLWGMRGLPGRGPVGTGKQLDLSAIVAFQVFLPRPDRAHALQLTRVHLDPTGGALDPEIPMPFVDPFGQYRHEDWAGKVKDEAELVTRSREEAQTLAMHLSRADRDAYGGWTGGPKLEATGWFRTAWHRGKAWLVTPEGNLFFSLGMDCVGHWRRTFVSGRRDWFEWLPEKDDPGYGKFFGYAENVHSMAEPIGGKGDTFGFYGANLRRKYGEHWSLAWRERTYARLAAWGFNTLGNWCQGDVIANSPLAYVVSGNISGVPPIEGATGYWAKMKDVFAPAFAEQVGKTVRRITEHHAGNPKCVGYFIDNELAWEGVAEGVLRSPAEQPARQAFLRMVEEKYATLGALNESWATGFETWEAIGPVAEQTDAMKADLNAYLDRFARHYFETIREALEKFAPNQLYLGCRFSTRPEAAVRACAAVADLVSFNRYETTVDCDLMGSVGETPVLIGEFHFGAMDRGMFHPGLVETENQVARAEAYARYVKSAAACPNVVGCHWFQYVDEPITGRTYDGENYNIGFVDVTDTPYPELTSAAQRVHDALYEIRYNR